MDGSLRRHGDPLLRLLHGTTGQSRAELENGKWTEASDAGQYTPRRPPPAASSRHHRPKPSRTSIDIHPIFLLPIRDPHPLLFVYFITPSSIPPRFTVAVLGDVAERMESNGPILLFVVLMSGLAKGAAMPCKAEGHTCQALVGYATQQATNLSAIASLFQLDDYRSLLGANAWELSLPASATLPAGYVVRVPILCACNGGTGVSAHRKPIYTVKHGEYLDMIARDIFAGLLPYADIAQANGIRNPDQIDAGQNLYIPLPCSCSDTDKHASNYSFSVLHYTYVIQSGDSMEYIASSLQASLTEIVALNDIFNASLISAGQVLDVPLKACSLGTSNSAPNNNLVVAKGNYAITASHCVQCSCGLEDPVLYCAPTPLGKSCSNMHCKNSNLMIGNITKQQTSHGCNVTTCSYTGYDNHTIFTSLMSTIQPKCPGKHVPLILTKPSSTSLPPPPPMISLMPPTSKSPPTPSGVTRNGVTKNTHHAFTSILILGLLFSLLDGFFTL